MKELTEKTIKVARKFPKQWSVPVRFIDLTEEVGELANAILGEFEEKPKQKIKSEVEDTLCDIVYDILLLAHDFNIDLKKSYLKMLRDLDKKLDKGEYGGKRSLKVLE